MNARKGLMLVVAAVVFCGVAWAFLQAYRTPAERLQGQIEARQYMVSSKVPGRLGELRVHKGDRVAEGDVLFSIDSPELEAKLVQIDAIDRIAGSLLDAVEGGTREERINAARSEYEKARVAEALAEKTWRRMRALAEEGVVARQRLDEAYTFWQVAVKTSGTASEVLRLAEAGPRREARDASRANEEVTASLREEVETLLADTRAQAPHAGIVSNVLLSQGELVPQGFPVVMVTDLDDAWALFNVREDLLQQFPQGAAFEVEIPALSMRATFRVTHIAVLGDFATWRATSSGQGFDLRTFEVELRPENPVPGLRPGMSVLLSPAR